MADNFHAEYLAPHSLRKFASQAMCLAVGQRVRVARAQRGGFGSNDIGLTGVIIKRRGLGKVSLRTDDGREITVDATQLDWGERLERNG